MAFDIVAYNVKYATELELGEVGTEGGGEREREGRKRVGGAE